MATTDGGAAAVTVRCGCRRRHLGWRRCPVQLVYVTPGTCHRSRSQEAQRFALEQHGWVRVEPGDLTCPDCAALCTPLPSGADGSWDVEVALLSAADAATWDDGSRLLDLSGDVLRERFAPHVTAALDRCARLGRLS